ncbi:golgin-84 [Orussus abietinus]|uniref:golgin-84 n=1 Tax=Orussus abietinus TaxID=222816 RepID=UPI00062534CD|nr:golgin-84 [Orussus abietinus]XP_012277577.1 golgin-84 [Orussus abietinus]
MAWLSGLADKAENLLNKIDQNTAAVLSKDKYEMESQQHHSAITWTALPSGVVKNVGSMSPFGSPKHFPYTRSTPNLGSMSPGKLKVDKEEELITYLNTPTVSPKRNVELMSLASPSVPETVILEPAINCSDARILSISDDDVNLKGNYTSIDVPDKDVIIPLISEGESVKSHNESERMTPETQLLSQKLLINQYEGNSAENDKTISQEHVHAIRVEDEPILGQTKIETELLVRNTGDIDLNTHLQSAQKDLEEKNLLLDKQQMDHQKEVDALKESIQTLTLETSQYVKQIAEMQLTVERIRSELNSTRSELDQHRARALKTLQEKEKLITELRSNVTTGLDDVTTVMELDQLRQERDSLREENQQLCEQLRLAREELTNAELKFEKIRQQSVETNIRAQEVITVERRRRLEVEEDARNNSEELKSLREELTRQQDSFSQKLQKQQANILRLRSQLSAASTPNSEIEARLSSLTQTLVVKQQALESLTTERNALRLQLEKIEHEHRDVMGNMRKNLLYNNVNDTDDVKAQIPPFFAETPFDTGVTRRVKRAYSSLDAISVRTGVFLRRYPLARILIFFYIALLQFWVLIVLLSQSPDAH